MNPVSNILRSSVGRKQLLGLTGIYLYFFLLVHLVGNLGLLAGAEYFNGYGHLMLHTLKKVVIPIEFTLVGAFLFHALMGIKLTLENRVARPDGYAVNASKAKNSPYARFMMVTGTWLLVFVIVHVPHFRFGAYSGVETVTYDGVIMRDLYGTTMRFFAKPWFAGFYIASFALLFSHLAHGVQSSLQSLGLNHPRYNAFIRKGSVVYAALICGGFAALALWAFLQKGA